MSLTTLKPVRKKMSRLHDARVSQQAWASDKQVATTSVTDRASKREQGLAHRDIPFDALRQAAEDMGALYERNLGWREAQLENAKMSIATSGRLSDNWNGYGAERPTALTREAMYRVLDFASSVNLIPDRVVPSAASGLFMLFKGTLADGTPLKADVEIFNSGEITFAYKPRGGQITVWEVDPKDLTAIKGSIERIRGLFA